MAKTCEQIFIINQHAEHATKCVEMYILKALQAKQAIFVLPLKNEENNSVTHKDNLEVAEIGSFYLSLAKYMFFALSKDKQEEINKKYINWQNNFEKKHECK